MTWDDIFVKARKHHHSVEVGKLSKKARDRLIEIRKDDLDELYSLRLGGTERIWGILDRGVFILLWWDPNHQVYAYTLKNT